MKRTQSNPNFFERNEKYLVWMLGTTIFCAAMMLLATILFKMKLPFTAWQLFVESIGALAFLVSVLSAWWGYTGDRRQAERTAGIQEQARISAKLDEHYMMLVNEKETDLRLEQTIERLSKSVEELRSQFGRLNAQVHQFESESQLRKRLEHLEKLGKKTPY